MIACIGTTSERKSQAAVTRQWLHKNVGIQLRRRQHLSTSATSSLVFFASAISDSRDTELIFRLPNPSKYFLPSVRSLESFHYCLAACLILSANRRFLDRA